MRCRGLVIERTGSDSFWAYRVENFSFVSYCIIVHFGYESFQAFVLTFTLTTSRRKYTQSPSNNVKMCQNYKSGAKIQC